MTEPKVEAGDRALETARKIINLLSIDEPIANYKTRFAAEIQSAMNAQERELRKMLRKAARNLYEASELLRDCGSGTAGLVYDSSQEILAELARIPDEAERLLAERGEGAK